MADTDFKINIVTLADLTGIKLTEEQLNALQTAAAAGNKDAIAALKKLTDAQKEAAAAANQAERDFTYGIRAAAGYGFVVGGAVAAAIRQVTNEQNRVTKELDKQFDSLVRNVQEWNKLAQVATTPEQLASVGEKAVAQIDQIRSKFRETNQEELTFSQNFIDTIVKGFKNAFTFGGDPNAKGPFQKQQEEFVRGLALAQEIAQERIRDITRTGLKEQQDAHENISEAILKETNNLEHQKVLLANLDVNTQTESWIAQEKVVERITQRLNELLKIKGQLDKEAAPTTLVSNLQDQLNKLNQIAKRPDLTPREQEQVRNAQIETERALREEQIKRETDLRNREAQALRDRFEKGFPTLPTQAGLPTNELEVNTKLLEAIQQLNIKQQQLLDLWR